MIIRLNDVYNNMLRFHNIAFGPIHSRRLGSSLGINLLPENGKLCNFDCVYCECGWNKDGTGDRSMPGVEDVAVSLENKLRECADREVHIDSITFSGHGEPTLNPHFPEIIDRTLELRDRFYPHAKVSVLSNATTVTDGRIFNALRKVDNPIMKLDASTDGGVAVVNRPSGHYDIGRIISGLAGFDGDFVLQTMFFRSPSFDTSAQANLCGWMDIVRRLKPREIMVYTLDRETPEKDLVKFPVEEMERLVRPLCEEGFHVQIRG